MIDWPRWLEVASFGMEVIGLGTAAWYASAKFLERLRENTSRSVMTLFGRPEYRAPELPSARYSEETVPKTSPEELLARWMVPFIDPFLDQAWNLGKAAMLKTKALGWLRSLIVPPLALCFMALCTVLFILLLPLAVVGYFFDLDNDIRLRIIVIAFGIGMALQTVAHFLK